MKPLSILQLIDALQKVEHEFGDIAVEVLETNFGTHAPAVGLCVFESEDGNGPNSVLIYDRKTFESEIKPKL